MYKINRTMILNKLHIYTSMLNGNQSKKNQNQQYVKKVTPNHNIMSKKEILSHKLKFALMNCDPRGDIYKRNKALCEIIWKEVEIHGIEIREEEKLKKLDNDK